ncbi:MAG TPA: MlaD family protein [Solirubrobacteraceae bacterium]|nr:MlaD family protein [Solirubrobacteraceae bacterium]
MRRILLALIVPLAVAAVFVLGLGAAGSRSTTPSYTVDFNNAFGLVQGADFKVDGIPAGTITGIHLDQRHLNARVTVKVTTLGIPTFHTSATCDSEPQSLIGEYFVSCDPGRSGPRLANGATIPLSHTTSTIPADLVLDVMQVPERERLRLIINSLGAGVAARSSDIATALDRALPALRNTDDLLALLDQDKSTLQSLTQNANTVVSALAANSGQIQRFITYANNAASDTATQGANFKQTLARLPGFLTQLRPDITQLGAAAVTNTPALSALDRNSGQLTTLLTALPGFANAARPAIRALGTASVTGRSAILAAAPTVRQLNTFSTHVPELARNLAIILPDLNTQSRATETNSRSPGGKGYSGLQALLQFAFNLAAATNYYGPTGHLLAVDGFVSAMCSNYATPATIAMAIRQYGPAYRSCYAQLGPNQPGVNTPDPSNPSACVPDPGGVETGQTVTVPTTACRLQPARTASAAVAHHWSTGTPGRAAAPTKSHHAPTAGAPPGRRQGPVKSLTSTLSQTLGGVSHTLSSLGATVGGAAGRLGGPSAQTGSSRTATTAQSTSTTESLLNYLLSP